LKYIIVVEGTWHAKCHYTKAILRKFIYIITLAACGIMSVLKKTFNDKTRHHAVLTWHLVVSTCGSIAAVVFQDLICAAWLK
jgi:hypothetical protein